MGDLGYLICWGDKRDGIDFRFNQQPRTIAEDALLALDAAERWTSFGQCSGPWSSPEPTNMSWRNASGLTDMVTYWISERRGRY